jgi:hypothetical protein
MLIKLLFCNEFHKRNFSSVTVRIDTEQLGLGDEIKVEALFWSIMAKIKENPPAFLSNRKVRIKLWEIYYPSSESHYSVYSSNLHPKRRAFNPPRKPMDGKQFVIQFVVQYRVLYQRMRYHHTSKLGWRRVHPN